MRNSIFKHLRVVNHVIGMIRTGHNGDANKLPSERELATRCECGVGTVRRGLQLLANNGFIQTRHGSGTFVKEGAKKRCSAEIAIIAQQLRNTEMLDLIHALNVAAEARGWTISIHLTGGNREKEYCVIDELAARGVAGVVRFPTILWYEQEMRRRMRSYGLRYVIVNDFWLPAPEDNVISFDEVAAMRMAVEHLVELGHRQVALLDDTGSARVRGIIAYADAVRDCGMLFDERLILITPAGGRPDLTDLFGKNHLIPTAMITFYGVIAIPLIQELMKMGLRVPEDVSVVNINSIARQIAGETDLTAAMPRNEEIASKALALIEEMEPGGDTRHLLDEPCFHVGATSGVCSATRTGAMVCT